MLEVASFILSLMGVSLTLFLERNRILREFGGLSPKLLALILLILLVTFFIWHQSASELFSKFGKMDSFTDFYAFIIASAIYITAVVIVSFSVIIFFRWPGGTLGVGIIAVPTFSIIGFGDDSEADFVVIVNVALYGALLGFFLANKLNKK